MNPSALDRTAAWLLNMNVQYLDHEGMEPESLRNREDLTQVEKVTCLLIQPPTLTNPLLSLTTSTFSPDTPTQLSFLSLPLISSHISLQTPFHTWWWSIYSMFLTFPLKYEVPKHHSNISLTEAQTMLDITYITCQPASFHLISCLTHFCFLDSYLFFFYNHQPWKVIATMLVNVVNTV